MFSVGYLSKKTLITFIFSAFFLLINISSLSAEEFKGVVHDISVQSSSLSVDVPPLLRIYVNSGTNYQKKSSFTEFKKGDRVIVEATQRSNGTYLAKKIIFVEHLEQKMVLDKDTIEIKDGQRFLLGVGQKAVLKKNGKIDLEIFSKEFINTFCKDGGFDCAGTGDIGMRLEVNHNGEKSEILLTSQETRKPLQPVIAEVHSYMIQLIEVGEDVVLLLVRQVQ
ncbi:MAG: hypothetical protein H7A32_00400 [Deltaproteobacteria bacterium]|nr:hypothetical protein [Deltaproteobacteria bacterium]